MKFVDFLVGKIVEGLNFIGSLIYKLFSFIAPVFGFLYELLVSVGYFFVKLATVAWLIIKLFTALLQFLGAIIVGLFRTIFSFFVIDYDAPINYPSTTLQGASYVMQWLNLDNWFNIFGYVVLAVLWIIFIVSIIRLFGGHN